MNYVYNARVVKVLDGDTIKVSLRLRSSRAAERDLGCHVFFEDGWVCIHESLRLMGINANEHNTPAGKIATGWLRDQVKIGDVVRVETIKDRTEKYGRFLAYVTRVGDVDTMNDRLVQAGHAVYWDGHGPRPVPE